MHQSSLYAILAALTAVHAIPVTEEFRVHRRSECGILTGCGPADVLETPARRMCDIVGGCGATESLATPGPVIARRWNEPEPSLEQPGFVGPKKTRSEPLFEEPGFVGPKKTRSMPLEVDGTTTINFPTIDKRMCAGTGCNLPIGILSTPMPAIARQLFESTPTMEDPGFIAPQKARSEPLEVAGTTSLNIPAIDKRMCEGDGCGLPIDPFDKRMCEGDGCGLPFEPVDKRIACPLDARSATSAGGIESECGTLPIMPIESPITEPITALKEKRIACRLALDGTTEGECDPELPIESPIAEDPIAKSKATVGKRIVICPLNADGTQSECSGPIITPISNSGKKSTGKTHAKSHHIIRPVPAAQTAAPVKVRSMPLEIVGTVPLQMHANIKGAQRNGKRSNSLEFNLNGGAVTAHTDKNGNAVVKVAGAVKNPTLTTRIVAATTAANLATVAAKGGIPAAAATAVVAA